jgi:hypothetical protein
MSRLFSSCMLCIAMLTTEAGAGAAQSPVLLPDDALRPTIAPADDLLREAALHAQDDLPPQPALADRWAMRPKLIAKVSLDTQTMRVFMNGALVHTWKVSTGDKGHRTPRGVWQPYRMHTMWRSRKYDNAPMPHSIFFTGGYAIHATPYVKRLGRPASHGCVRLHPDHARALFRLAKQVGPTAMRVIVQN